MGDICRGVQTPSVTSYQIHTNVVAVTLELHKIICFPSQSLDITLVTQCMQPFTLCQAIDKPHAFLYLDTENKKCPLIQKLEFDQLVRKGQPRFHTCSDTS